MTKRIAVYCASNADDVPALVTGARDFVDAIAERGFGIVYGGARVGLMGVVAQRAIERGVEVIGVIPKRLLDRELLMPGLSKVVIVETMAERKALMSEEAAAYVALPGAIGTLDEICEQWTLRHIGVHDKPIGFHDVDGYWAPLLGAIRAMHARGVVREAHLAIPVVHHDARTLLKTILP